MAFKIKAVLDPFTEEQEKEIFLQLQTTKQKEKVLSVILDHNLKLIFKIAREFKNSPVPFDDLISEGCIGLVWAAEKFQLDKGTKFITYAAWWVRQKMHRCIEKQGRTVKVPARANIQKARLLHAEEELREILGYKPSLDELAEYTDTPVYIVKNLMYALGQSVSLDADEDDTEDEGISRKEEEALSHDPNMDPEWERRKEQHKQLLEVVGTLSVRDQFIITLRYGLDGYPPASLEEVAQEVGKCRERVRQLQEEAEMEIRRKMKKNKLK